ncbi:IS3 family transposase [Streptomyces sp. NBC_00289]|uniref:IS3 family transposase n=1 Tax=Streptomyces sp. NBC_00289 TaxID=2975703 RepID=UPI00352D6EB1
MRRCASRTQSYGRSERSCARPQSISRARPTGEQPLPVRRRPRAVRPPGGRRPARGLDTHVHRDSDATYGVPRVTAELRDGGGQAVTHERVARVMRAIGLAGVRLRRQQRTTVADPAAAEAPNLIGRDFTAPAVNEKYVGTSRTCRSAARNRSIPRP